MSSAPKEKQVSISEILSFPNRIQNTLIFYYLFPVLLIFIFLSAFFYISTKNSLDDELGSRLQSIAQMTASQLKPIQFVSLQTTGSDGQVYDQIMTKFQEISKKNHIQRIYLLDTQSLFFLDTQSKTNFGNTFERLTLHTTEIKQTLEGQATASILFKGSDGHFYKSAFAPIKDAQDQVIALVGVDGNATFFKNLRQLETRLIVAGILFIAIILLISILLSRKIVTPIDLLVLAAKRIGDGQIEKRIRIQSKSEIGFLAYVMDEMRKKILERDQSMQVMLRGIAHEIRNPLGGIELFSGILQEKIQDPSSLEALDKIIKETNHLKKLVDDFLNFAKKPALQLAQVDIREWMEDLDFYWKSKLAEQDIEWKLTFEGLDQKIEMDPDQMVRVFHNLIENASHAVVNSKSKKISLHVWIEKNHTTFTIKDTGHGIDSENLSKLFTPFYSTKPFGNGLGLSLVQKVINAHGGDIEVESTLNVGTTITIILPNRQ